MAMKYTSELTEQITKEYNAGLSVEQIAENLTLRLQQAAPGAPTVPTRSIIAKLSSIGVYKRKEYLTKRGEVPIKKEEYVEKIAALLDVNAEILESLEKVNKGVLALLAQRLEQQ